MISPAEQGTIQIELTSACVLKCSNCTRFCGTHKTPFFIEEELFYKAIDSLEEFAKRCTGLVGFMGGEPLLHPKFKQFCEYAQTKIAREKLGLWTTFPPGPKYYGYRDVIVRTFGNILLNDHSRNDIYHAPLLVASEDVIPDKRERFLAIEHCWIQERWSSAINPKGAFFCEVAASLSDLFDGPKGWDVEPGWWKRTPKDFTEQMEWACNKCGGALPLERRKSVENIDDVSMSNFVRLEAIGSRKIKDGLTQLHTTFKVDGNLLEAHGYPNQTYKDLEYRRNIASKYNIGLKLNSVGYCEPFLLKEGGVGHKATMPVA